MRGRFLQPALAHAARNGQALLPILSLNKTFARISVLMNILAEIANVMGSDPSGGENDGVS